MILECNPREVLLAIMDVIHEYLQELKYDYLVADNNIDLTKRATLVKFLTSSIQQGNFSNSTSDLQSCYKTSSNKNHQRFRTMCDFSQRFAS